MMKKPALFKVLANLRGSLWSLLIINCGTDVSAQYELLYQHTYDPDNAHFARAIVDDGLGNTCLAGEFANSITLGSTTLTTLPLNLPGDGWPKTGFVGKFNSVSNTWLWAKQITLVAGTGQQTFVQSGILDMARDNSGNTYITGFYAGTIKFDNIQLTSTKLGSIPSNDIFVAKLNATGSFLWAKSFGSKAGFDSGETICLDASNNIYLAGRYTNKKVTCNGGSVDQWDIYLAKLDNAGNTLWQKRYASNTSPCNGNSIANDLHTDGSGNVYMTGRYIGTVSFGSGSVLAITSISGTEDVFTAKINGSGTTQWVKSAGSNSNFHDSGYAIHADPSGNIYVGGKIETSAFVIKYNPSGGFIWSANPFPPSAEFAGSLVHNINPYNGSLLVNDGRIGFKSISMSDGSVVSSDSIIGNTSTNYFGITDVDPSGSGFVFGLRGQCGTVSISNLTFTASCEGQSDIFMARNANGSPPAVQQPGELDNYLASSHEVAEIEFEVYPNPANDQLYINLPGNGKEATLFIQNQFGHTLWFEKFESQRRNATINLDGNSFQSGIYFLICLSNGEVKTERFVVDK